MEQNEHDIKTRERSEAECYRDHVEEIIYKLAYAFDELCSARNEAGQHTSLYDDINEVCADLEKLMNKLER